MCLGWPAFNTQDSTLQYCGNLPSTCACSTMHPSLRGLATQGGFRSFLPSHSVHSFGLASSAGCKSHSCTVPLGMVYRAVQLVLSLMVVSLVTASPWLIHRTRWQHCTGNGKQTHLQGRYSEIPQHPYSTLSSSQGDWLVTLCFYTRCSRPLENFWILVEQRALTLVFPWCLFVLLRLLFLFVLPVFAVTFTFLVFLPISVTLRIIAVLRVLQGFSQCCLAVQPSTGRSVLSTPRHLQMGRCGSILLSLTSPSDSRTRLICREFHEVQHLWTLSTLRHLDFRARRRRGSFHGSLMSELGGDARSWTLLASWLRDVVLGSRVPPHRHVRVCNHLLSVVGREDRMAMAVPRCLQRCVLPFNFCGFLSFFHLCLLLQGWGPLAPYIQVDWWTGTQRYADGIALPWTSGLYQAAHAW